MKAQFKNIVFADNIGTLNTCRVRITTTGTVSATWTEPDGTNRTIEDKIIFDVKKKSKNLIITITNLPADITLNDCNTSMGEGHLNGTTYTVTISEVTHKVNITTAINSSQCTGKHIIELEELPEAGIAKGEVYKVKSKILKSVAMLSEDGQLILDYVGYFMFIFGPIFGEGITESKQLYFYSKEIPTFVPESEGGFCYVENEDMLYVYDSENGVWVSGLEAGDLPYVGSITSPEQITEPGMYAFIGYENPEFYELTSESYKLIVFMNGMPIDYGAFLSIEITAVPTRPTENIKESNDTSLYCYYIEDEENVFIYKNDKWIVASEEMGAEFGGIISNVSQVTNEEAFYILTNNGGLMNYLYPEGTIKVTETGLYDIAKYSSIRIAIPDKAVYGSRKISLSSLWDFQNKKIPVNFTTTYKGETINCIGIRTDIGLMDVDVSLYYILEDSTELFVGDTAEYNPLTDKALLYVDFGTEPQLIISEALDFIQQATPTFEIVPMANITFTVDGIAFQSMPMMTWKEYAPNYETTADGFSASSSAVTKDGKKILYNGVAVDWLDTIIDGAAYTSSPS